MRFKRSWGVSLTAAGAAAAAAAAAAGTYACMEIGRASSAGVACAGSCHDGARILAKHGLVKRNGDGRRNPTRPPCPIWVPSLMRLTFTADGAVVTLLAVIPPALYACPDALPRSLLLLRLRLLLSLPPRPRSLPPSRRSCSRSRSRSFSRSLLRSRSRSWSGGLQQLKHSGCRSNAWVQNQGHSFGL